jgi:hypothetical protein
MCNGDCMMRFLTLAACLFCLHAKAVSLNVTFAQDNWWFDLRLTTSDGSSGLFKINGVTLTSITGNDIIYTGLLNPVPKQLIIGENIPSITFASGETIFGNSFTITQPTGEPPTSPPQSSVPDVGSSIVLIGAAISLLFGVRHQLKG